AKPAKQRLSALSIRPTSNGAIRSSRFTTLVGGITFTSTFAWPFPFPLDPCWGDFRALSSTTVRGTSRASGDMVLPHGGVVWSWEGTATYPSVWPTTSCGEARSMPQHLVAVKNVPPHVTANLGHSLEGATASVNPYCGTTRRRLLFHLSIDSRSIDRTWKRGGRTTDGAQQNHDRQANRRGVLRGDPPGRTLLPNCRLQGIAQGTSAGPRRWT